MKKCLATFPKYISYSYDQQQELLPNILTVGAVLEAVPLDWHMESYAAGMVFDARETFKDRNTRYLATKYVYDHYVNSTTGLAMMNPGYDVDSQTLWDPELINDMDSYLVDLVYLKKLFAIFLVNGCIDFTEEHMLFNEITSNNPWPEPIGVYGYNNSWMVLGGCLFEAQATCSDSANMGAIASIGHYPNTSLDVNNLSFFSSRSAPITDPNEIPQNEPEDIHYDPNRTYVAFIVGDGDNIAYMLDMRYNWMRQRLDRCQQDEDACAPITWSISPHLPSLAPDITKWYYDMSHRTGKDYFMLPPSGYLYTYPSSLREDVQDSFIELTEDAGRLLGTCSTVHWEWFDSWFDAEANVIPKYARQDSAVKGVFAMNVPYMIPTFTWWNPCQYYKVLEGNDGGKVVLFRPQEWRAVDNSSSGVPIMEDYSLSPDRMADKIGGFSRGTVAQMYMTSDGGLTLENSFVALTRLLPEHVTLVSADAATRLALEAHQLNNP